MDLPLLEQTLRERGEPAFRARQVWEWTARGASGYDAMTNLPRTLRAELAEVVPFSTLDGRDRTRVARRHGEDALPHRRRPPGRGRADALPRRPALALPLLAVGLPAHVHVLRDGCDGVRPQPDGVGDPRPGAPLPPAHRGRPLRLHGDGRADAQPRRGALGGAAAAGSRHHAPADDDLHGRLAARPETVRGRGGRADPARALAPCGGRRAPVADHARERAVPGRGRRRRVPAPGGERRDAASSSST